MQGNFQLWLAWAAFGTLLALLLWRRYLPLVRQASVLRASVTEPEPVSAPRAWLYCEEGAPLDRRVQWFGVRMGGRTVVGARPRSNTSDTDYIYLTAEDIVEDHALIRYEPAERRYHVSALDSGLVLHNNEALPAGADAELADGDTLDLGRFSRFRFTYTGPEAA
jgi:hypothetical protein